MRKILVGAVLATVTTLWSIEQTLADPPPWAPAHGYRAKHKAHGGNKGRGRHHDATVQEQFIVPIDLSLGACSRQDVGAILGGAVGGVLGSRVGSGSGKTAATIGGTIIGVIVGGSIGRTMDDIDQNCVGQAIEQASDGQTIRWNGTDDQSYAVTPTATYQDSSGQFCREYQTTVVIGGKAEAAHGRACRQPDGSWKVVGV